MSLLKDYDLFIFDWDNTLSSSTAPIRAMQLLKKDIVLWYAKAHREKYRKELTMKIDGMLNKAAENNFYAKLYDTYSRVFRPGLKSGAIDVLKLLKENRKKVAIFSDARTYRLFSETRDLGVLKYVDFALAAESINYYKPNPTGLLLIVDRFRATKARTMYIGDMASDILTAKFAGVSSCGVADGLDGYEGLKSAGAEHVFRDLNAMLSTLSK
jgi:phosphoglycolate phosphatase-like HAD superfamily hydrolase